jgi:hypothetical protein
MAALFQELKRRKVFRVTALYAVVAWLLLQVADTLSPILDLPDFASRLVFFFLIIFFPIALFLSWAYEMTPEGIKADAGEESEVGAPRSSGATAIVFGLVVLAAGAGLYFYNQPAAEIADIDTEELPLLAQDISLDKSIAVLPFTAFSSNPDEQFFADGLADTLLHKLAQLSDIRVISRSSSFQYRGDSVDVRLVVTLRDTHNLTT